MHLATRAAACAALLALAACSSSKETPPPTPTGALTGQVRLAGLASHADVTVTLAGPTSASAVTGADGRYAFSNLEAGPYVVLATAPSTVEGTVTARANVAAASVTASDLSLTPVGAVSGTVTLGLPAGNGGTTVYVPGTSAMAMTDDAGGYVLQGLPAGAHTVVATRAGYAAGQVDVTVAWKAVASAPPLELQGLARARLSGRVVVAGAPSPGPQQVTVIGPVSAVVETDAAGSYALTGVAAGTYAITATVGDTAEHARTVTVAVPNAGATAEDLIFTGTGAVHGRATLGAPTGNAGIAVSVPGAAAVTMTDDAGEYLLLGVPAGRRDVVATFAGYASALGTSVAVAWKGTVAAPELTLAPAGGSEVRGRIRLVGGDPAGAEVALAGTGLATTAAADGAFAFGHVPEGLYTLTVRKGEWATDVPGVLSMVGGTGYLLDRTLYPLGTIEVQRARQLSGRLEACLGWFEGPDHVAWFNADCDAAGRATWYLASTAGGPAREVGRGAQALFGPGNAHAIMAELDAQGTSTLTSIDGATGTATELARGVAQVRAVAGRTGGAVYTDAATGHLRVAIPGRPAIDLGAARFDAQDPASDALFYVDVPSGAGTLRHLDLLSGADTTLAADSLGGIRVVSGFWTYSGGVGTSPVGYVRHVVTGTVAQLGPGAPSCFTAIGTKLLCNSPSGGPAGQDRRLDLVDTGDGSLITLSTTALSAATAGDRVLVWGSVDLATVTGTLSLYDASTGVAVWSRSAVSLGPVLNDGRFPFYSGYTPATGGDLNLLDPASLEVVTASGSACFRGFPQYSADGSRIFCQGPAVGSLTPLYSASARTSGPATLVASAVGRYVPNATGTAVLHITSGSIYLAGVATTIASGLSPTFDATVNGVVVLDTPVVGTTTTYTAAVVDFSGTRRPLGAGWSSLTVYSDRTHVKLVADHPGTGVRDVQVANAVTGATTTLRPAVCFDAFVGDRLVVIEASDTAAPRLASLPLPGASGAALGLGLANCSPGVFGAPGSTKVTYFRTFDSASGTGSLAQASVDGTGFADLTTVASMRRLGDRLTYLGSYDAASGTGELRSLDLVSGGVTAHLGRVSRYVSTSAATLVGLRSGSPPPYGFQDGLYRIDLP